MIGQIKEVLQRLGIDTYLIEEQKKISVELFFIRHTLDMNRKKDVANYSVTVYRDFEKNDKSMRGFSIANIHVSMTGEEIEEVIKDAYYAASFVANPYYPLPKGTKEQMVQIPSALSDEALEDHTQKLVQAMFCYDTDAICFVNSAEIFLYYTECHMISSEGTDVSYGKYSVEGEFVAQCTKPQDVETYKSFYYDDLEIALLSELVKETLEMTKARSEAQVQPKQGSYPVILAGEYVKTLMSYYLDCAGANMIYPKYSSFKVGENVQGECVEGDVLNIVAKADVPYSNEGIPMIDRPLIQNGVLQFIHGPSRFAHYLEVEPTGYYTSIELPEGKVTLDALKQGEYLYIVNFSDFQMDALTGYFGGEIRLAFYSDGEKVIPVTGGSISGSIESIKDKLVFSKETDKELGYKGPKAVRFIGATIAGC